ncbi:MAG: nitrogen fixation protein NifX [Cyanobacteria bacterium P01_H01_bin.15]
MKVAFTTNDSIHVNAHFGSARQIDIYEASGNGFTFLESLEFQKNLKQDGNEDKLGPKLAALSGCSIVYVGAIGGSAASRLIRQKVTPIKAESSAEIIPLKLAELVETINNSPPPWLRKVLNQSQPQSYEDTFETIEEEVVV